MPKFMVPVTRDTTETTMVDVVAATVEEAVEKAVEEAHGAPHNFGWTPNDCTGGDPYFAGGNDFEAVEQIGMADQPTYVRLKEGADLANTCAEDGAYHRAADLYEQVAKEARKHSDWLKKKGS